MIKEFENLDNTESMDLYKKVNTVINGNPYTTEITNRSTTFLLKINIPNLIKGIEEFANTNPDCIEVEFLNVEDKTVFLSIHFNYNE